MHTHRQYIAATHPLFSCARKFEHYQNHGFVSLCFLVWIDLFQMKSSLDVPMEYRSQCEIAFNAFTFKLNAQKILVLNRLSFYFEILYKKNNSFTSRKSQLYFIYLVFFPTLNFELCETENWWNEEKRRNLWKGRSDTATTQHCTDKCLQINWITQTKRGLVCVLH